MGILAFIILIIGLISYFIARYVYKHQVKMGYKNPMLAASIVFVLTLGLIAAAIFFLIINNISLSRE